ncbi:MAG: glycosyltransferase [Candidatus Hydrogenedentes bacterium]|nr:glycosyltransferase [Candidatus Hydrogenedentota bacterium]
MGEPNDTKPRVLLIHNFLSPFRIPLFRELATRMDLDVWILGDIRAVRDWPADAPEAGFRLRRVPHFLIPLGSRYNVILLNPTLPFDLIRNRYDAIIFCAWDTPAAFYTALHARLTHVPFILWSGSTAAEDTRLRRATLPIVRWLVKSATAWLAYGTRAKEYLVSLGAAPERTMLAYNTVEIDEFAKRAAAVPRAETRARLEITTRHLILYAGNLLDLKGVPELLDAFALFSKQHSDATLLLVGSGNGEAGYREFCATHGITDRVRFEGFVAREELARYYAIADLLVLPSRSEIWGLVINEALACGLPVLATDVCGAAPDLLQDGVNGYVVPSRNPRALCNAMLRFFDDTTDREAMTWAARDAIAPFTVARTADAFVAALKCALDSHAS